jgi:hypothetical protein
MSILDKKLEEAVEKKEIVNENINVKPVIPFISLGIQMVIIYLLFIFLVGNLLASFLGYNNLYFLAIILGTITNINSVIKIAKGFKHGR